MTKTELKENITKIEQILQSENYEAGFELLKTLDEPELNESLADLIQNTVFERYFQVSSVQKEIDKGLEILEVLLPNLTRLDLRGCSSLQVPSDKSIMTTRDEVVVYQEEIKKSLK